MQVLWGHQTPQLLQHTMALFEEDLQMHATGKLHMAPIEKLAGLGTRGQHGNNVWRDLKACLPEPRLPKLHYLWLPMKHNVLGRFAKNVAMILPHELFSAIYHCYPGMWTKMIYGSEATCKNFWGAVSDSEHYRSAKLNLYYVLILKLTHS